MASEQWKSVGAPIGLVVAINRGNARQERARSNLQHKKPTTDKIHVHVGRLQLLSKVVIAVDWFMPFDHQTLFKRGVVHAKSSSEVQGHVLNWAELWLVWAALLLGVTVSMWGMFPDGDFLHGAFALTFNIVAFFTCLFGFGATGLFGVLFVLSSAVSASAFKRFHLVHMGTY